MIKIYLCKSVNYANNYPDKSDHLNCFKKSQYRNLTLHRIWPSPPGCHCHSRRWNTRPAGHSQRPEQNKWKTIRGKTCSQLKSGSAKEIGYWDAINAHIANVRQRSDIWDSTGRNSTEKATKRTKLLNNIALLKTGIYCRCFTRPVAFLRSAAARLHRVVLLYYNYIIQ